jgi:hypothetical protein
MDGCFTSIAADNDRARRFLESSARGMPVYRHVGDLMTMLVRVRPPRRQNRPRTPMQSETRVVSSMGESDVDAMMKLLRAEQHHFQFAPCWSRNEVEQRFSTNAAAHLICGSGKVEGCALLWDQRPFKQAVVARYSRRLALLRPLHNLVSHVVGRGVCLPRPRKVIPSAFVTHLVAPIAGNAASNLIDALMQTAHGLRVSTLAIGLDSRDPRADQIMGDFRPHVYRTRLYTVNWPNIMGDVALDGRLFYPEIALL